MLCRTAFEFFQTELGRWPGNYLEFGVYDGETLRALALKYPAKQFFGVDPFIEDGNTFHVSGYQKGQAMPRIRELALANLDSLPNIHFYEETSRAFADRFYDVQDEDRLGLSAVLVDGSHWYDDAISDLRFASRALKRGGIVFYDDLTTPDVGRAVREWESEQSQLIEETVRLNINCGYYRMRSL